MQSPANGSPVQTAERNLAARVRFERDRRGWSYEALSREMKRVGCPMAVSSLNGVERGEPPRRVRVAELYAFAEVFDLYVDQLIAAPATYRAARFEEQLDDYLVRVEQVVRHRVEAQDAERVLRIAAKHLTADELRQCADDWAHGHWLDPPTAEVLVAFLLEESAESPFAPAVIGGATVVPGKPNLLDEDTGR